MRNIISILQNFLNECGYVPMQQNAPNSNQLNTEQGLAKLASLQKKNYNLTTF